jgi:hypothetical protein
MGIDARSDEDAEYFQKIYAFDPHGTGWGENH